MFSCLPCLPYPTLPYQAAQEAEALKHRLAAQADALARLKRESLLKLIKAGKAQAYLRKKGVAAAVARIRRAQQDQMKHILEQIQLAQQAGGKGGKAANALSALLASLPDAVRNSVLANLPSGGLEMAGLAGMAGFPGVSGPSADPFLAKLGKIENVVSELRREQERHHDPTFGKLFPMFVDPFEKSIAPLLQCKKPVAVPSTQLDAKKYLVYRFGTFVADLAASVLQEPPFSLLVASQLPPKPKAYQFEENCFANSFHYDPASRTIFIHQQRLGNVGLLGLIVAHVIAHIKANEWSDKSDVFTRHFYMVLSCYVSELFFARSARGQAQIEVIAPPTAPAAAGSVGDGLIGSGSTTDDSIVAALGAHRSHCKSSWTQVESQWQALSALLNENMLVRKSLAPSAAQVVALKDDVIGEFVDLSGVGSSYEGTPRNGKRKGNGMMMRQKNANAIVCWSVSTLWFLPFGFIAARVHLIVLVRQVPADD